MGLKSPPASSEAVRNTMLANRATDTGPEREVRRMLRQAGRPGYRLHWRIDDEDGRYICRPDIAYPGRKVAIFVHGCFWHQHKGCRRGNMPQTNTGFWRSKLERNAARDSKQLAALKTSGWRALVIWECEIKDEKRVVARLRRFLEA